MKKDDCFNVKESLVGAAIAIALGIKAYIWLKTGQAYVNPLWMSFVAAFQMAVCPLIAMGLIDNADRVYRNEKKKAK